MPPLPPAPPSPHLDRALARIADALAALGDPFAELPILVADRSLETWVRHRLAEREGIAAGLVFVSIDDAVEARVQVPGDPLWWRWTPPSGDRWGAGPLEQRVLGALAALRRDAPALVSALPVADEGVPLAWRHLAFAREVAGVVSRLCRERPDHAVAAGEGRPPEGVPGWLARVCAAVGTHAPDSPAARRLAALAAPSPPGAPSLLVIGATALSPTTRALLDAWGAELWGPPDPGDLAEAFADPARRALRLRPCFGPLREVEELRAWLLHHLQAGALHPEEVRVLTPAPELYGPLLCAVFARQGPHGDVDDPAGAEPPPRGARGGPPRIPVQARGLGRGHANPLADALVQVLALGEERVDAPRILALLACRPVAARFDLDAEELAAVQGLLVESGARWAFDADDRARAGQPADPRNTLEQGLERLALGRLLPTDAFVDDPAHGPVVAMEAGSRERVDRAAKLTALVRGLRAAVDELRAAPADTPAGWRLRATRLLDAFTATSDAAAWLRLDVEERLDEVLHRDVDRQLTLGAIRRLLESAFTLPLPGETAHVGAVDFAPLGPHGARPARVLALLGMSDGAFPRAATPREWDPFRRVEPGEVDDRTLDRRALAEHAAAAGTVWVSWTGVEMRRGEVLPACVPVEELAHARGLTEREVRRAGLDAHALDAPWRRPPRHAWGEPAEHLHDADLYAAAAALRLGAAPSEPDDAGLADPLLPTTIAVDELVRALVNPSRTFLYDRLGVYLREDDDPAPGREAVAVDKLDEYGVKDALLAAWTEAAARGPVDAEATAGRVLRRLAGEGALPLGAGGELVVGDLVAPVAAVWEAWSAGAGGEEDVAIRAVVHDVPVFGEPEAPRVTLEVRGTVARLGAGGVVESVTVGDPTSGKRRLAVWVRQLVLAAGGRVDGGAGPGSVAGRVVGPGGEAPLPPIGAAEATEILRALLSIWRRARTRPVPLFERTSPALAAYDAARGTSGERQALAAVVSTWSSAPRGGGRAERADPWVAELHPAFDPEAAAAGDGDALELATIVWAPLMATGGDA